MANNSEKPKYRLKLLIDEEKNRVVLAEAGKDFVDVLCDLLTLPMGTIVKLLEKYQNPPMSIIGCLNNLYRNVLNMDDDMFETQACKNMLLFPKSMKKDNCRRLKLNVDDDAEETKFFVCPNAFKVESCRLEYSNFCTSMCSCGKTMNYKINFEGDGVDVEYLFSFGTSFIITDDMKVKLNSMALVLNVLNGLGYAGFNKLREMVIDVCFEKVLALLVCSFTSETPMTDTFLRTHCIPKKFDLLSNPFQETSFGRNDKKLTVKVFVRNGTVIYAECREEFVDLLFSLLAIPLEFKANMGCVGKLCSSFVQFRNEKYKEFLFVSPKCVLPYYYNFRVKLLDVYIQKKPEYEFLISSNCVSDCKLSKEVKKSSMFRDVITTVTPVSGSVGFVKGDTKFIVTDDLVVTPINLSLTISLLSKLQLSFNDIKEHTISIGEAEAANILKASLFTNSALTNGLSNILSKIKPKEATQSTKKIIKSEE